MQNFEIMRYILPILLSFLCLIGCTSKNSETMVSSEARVSTFTFQSDTANPGLTAAMYTIEHREDTGLIYSKDSLRFGTQLDSVVPLVTYKATPGIVRFILPDTTIISTGADTINFNQKPIYLHITASDMQTNKWYLIDIAAHQADPDLYVWTCLTENMFAPQPVQNCETKAFRIHDNLVVYVNNGLSTSIYQSTNGEIWAQLADKINDLPVPCHVRDIVQHNDTLYYIDGTSLYKSADLLTWSKTDYAAASFTPINMLLAYNNLPWCIVQDKESQQLMLATIIEDSIQVATNIADLKDGFLPAEFPISDFSALAFSGSSERPRAMIVGGRTINGDIVNSRWNLEYASQTGYRLKDFSISQPSFESLIGVSIIHYDNHFIMFGGTDNDLTLRSDILYSDDEGMNWYVPDTASNKLPATYLSRSNQTVLVDDQDNIYIIGGQSKTRAFSDVYRGFRNATKWE